MNSEIKLDRWFFHLGETKRFGIIDHNAYYNACKAGGAMGSLDIFKTENRWTTVSIPHDWLTQIDVDKNEAPAGGYKKRGSAWYYTTVTLPEDPIEYAELIFDGVLGICEVYVNGTLAMRNFSGYNRFSCDVGNYLTKGENLIAVHVNGEVWEGWWYEGAGIYRPVTLKLRNFLHFKTDDIFVRSEKINDIWYLVADIECTSNGKVTSVLKDANGVLICEEEGYHLRKEIKNPNLWSPDAPYLYTFEAILENNGETYDTFTCCVGFRNVEWNAETGMSLNGKNLHVKGICCHQDHAGVGAAVEKTIVEYRISRLKELGINAYRCAHHAPSEDLLDVCDKLGMLVMVENRHYNTSEDTMVQLEAMVKISRNHPCVFLYSLFNEELWQREERGLRIARELKERVMALDETRAVTAAMNGGVLKEKNASDVLDVIGINYFIHEYENCHNRQPQKALIGTENCPTFATRGIYKEDREKQVWSSYGDKWADTFSESLDETMKSYEETPFVAGHFVWSGFDYRGEPQPYEWPSIASHWGVMDSCGFKKDTAYYLAGYYKEDLFVHLLPHWNHNDGDNVRVCAFTNAHTVSLYLNGKCYGEQEPVSHRAEWTVPFEAGSIRAVAIGNGNETAEDEVRTAGSPAALAYEITEGENIRIIDITVVDAYGIPVPNADFEVKCEGNILGVGNGNPNSHHSDRTKTIETFSGKCQIIARGKVKITCDGIADDEI